jgi:hypothetical protein
LNLQDPGSMTADRYGNLVLTSQADDEIVTIHQWQCPFASKAGPDLKARKK